MRRTKKRKAFGAALSIAVAALVLAACIATIIINCFVPVKYLSAYVVRAEERNADELRITFLDVAFGDCSLVELPGGKTMLIDGGNGDYDNMLSLLTLLNRRGVEKIDYLVCTSVKDEHCGGLSEVVLHKEIGAAYIPYCKNTRVTEEYHRLITALEEKDVPCITAQVGEGVSDGQNGWFFSFLSPVNSLSPNGEYAELNQSATAVNIEKASAVLWLEYGENCFLFTSDARVETLERIVTEYGLCRQLNQPYCAVDGHSVELEKCDFLTVPGHGGESNTYAPFFDLVTPRHAVVSVGENFSGYPDSAALSNVYNYASPFYTKYDGDITVVATSANYQIFKEK